MHGQLMRKPQRKPKQERNRNTSVKNSIRRLVRDTSLEFEFSVEILQNNLTMWSWEVMHVERL